MNMTLERFMQRIPEGLDAVLITSDINRRYFTSFPSSAGTILVTRDKGYLIIDSRYVEAARAKITSCEVILQDKLYNQLSELMERHSVRRLGIEGETVSISEYLKLKDKLPGVEIAFDNEVSDCINKMRRVKTPDEMLYIQQAQDITDETFQHMLTFIKPGLTEREIALEIDSHNYRLGADGPAFSTIVASGRNSSKPHAVPSDKAVEKGDFITMDYGAMVEGYCSDMTRTIAVGEVSEKQQEVYATVLSAQLKSMEAIRPGVPMVEVDKVARDLINATAYKGCFGHGLGHSLGLEIHEPPNFNPTSTDVTEEGYVMSVEPGIYLAGEFGVRIEDILAVTAQGYHTFTGSPKELIVL